MRKLFRYIGPGLITAALVFGPGSLTITSKLGSVYAYQHIWVILLAILFMLSFTEMGARIGIATNDTLLCSIQQKWGKVASVMLGFGIFAITASFQAGNTIGASLAFAELFHTDTSAWIVAFTLGGISLLFFRSFYKVLEKVMISLVAVMLLSFLITLLLARPDLSTLFTGLIPSLPEGSEVLSIALIASSFSAVGAFYQGYLVREKGWKRTEARQGRREAMAGVLVLGMISLFILINAASILYPQGIQVNSATDMGLALEPLYGNTATVIFMLGLFGASFSSLIGNATIGGSLLADALSLGNSLSSTKVRGMIMLVMLIGAAIALRFGRLPLELIVFAQAITVIIAPLVGLSILVLANDRKRMGDLKNTLTQNIFGIMGLLLLLGLSASQLYLQFIR
jgi:Mn2+/Fe2+ NRAMP family transporter